MPDDIRARLHPSLLESFVPIEADIALHLPGDAGAIARDILRAASDIQLKNISEIKPSEEVA